MPKYKVSSLSSVGWKTKMKYEKLALNGQFSFISSWIKSILESEFCTLLSVFYQSSCMTACLSCDWSLIPFVKWKKKVEIYIPHNKFLSTQERSAAFFSHPSHAYLMEQIRFDFIKCDCLSTQYLTLHSCFMLVTQFVFLRYKIMFFTFTCRTAVTV